MGQQTGHKQIRRTLGKIDGELISSQSDKKLSQSIRKDDKLNKEPNGSDFIDKSPSRAIITSTAATAILQKLEKLKLIVQYHQLSRSDRPL